MCYWKISKLIFHNSIMFPNYIHAFWHLMKNSMEFKLWICNNSIDTIVKSADCWSIV